MNRINVFIPLCGILLLSGCAGTASDFECNATTSDTCMTMEQANEKAKRVEAQNTVKQDATSLPRLAEGNFRTTPVPVVTQTVHPVSIPVASTGTPQKMLAPRPLYTPPVGVKTVSSGSVAPRPVLSSVVPVRSVTPVSEAARAVPPRPLRVGEQTAALWIAPYIDNQDIYHQPSSVFFVIKPSVWGKPRLN
ncbi:type IV conjugative transfer system lipoprotein TraV [Citrobacter braakii]|uniref:type IV conjugative transfer system lipoprotein TraV n=1 Tax=Citrobacter braakii TaxID=57706 RepID=UPI00351CE6FE